jgi:hypothetical protein
MVKDTLHLLQEHVEDSESSAVNIFCYFSVSFSLLVKLDHIDVNNQTSILVHCGIQLLL